MADRKPRYLSPTMPVDWIAQADVQEKLEALATALREAEAIVGEILILAVHREAEAADAEAQS